MIGNTHPACGVDGTAAEGMSAVAWNGCRGDTYPGETGTKRFNESITGYGVTCDVDKKGVVGGEGMEAKWWRSSEIGDVRSKGSPPGILTHTPRLKRSFLLPGRNKRKLSESVITTCERRIKRALSTWHLQGTVNSPKQKKPRKSVWINKRMRLLK